MPLENVDHLGHCCLAIPLEFTDIRNHGKRTVRMAVAKFESIPLTLALASTAVRPANTAESNAQWSQFISDFFQRIERTTPPSST